MKLRNLLILCSLVILVLFLVGCVPPETTIAKDTSVKEVEKTAEVKEEAVVAEKLNSMNEYVDVDYLRYKVTKAESFNAMGDSMFKKETNGKFVKVYLDILNNAKETKQIFTPRFVIIDNQERKFDRIADDMFYIAEPLELGKQIQPGLSTSGAVVFELPKDSTDLVLQLGGDWTSASEIKVSLDKVTDIGKDLTLKQKNDKMFDDIMADSQKKADEMMKNLG